MYNAFEYIETIVTDVPELEKVYKTSGLSSMEELLSDLKNNPNCCVVVRDSGDGHLNLKDRRLSNSYQSLYVFVKAKLNDHASRLSAKRSAMTAGVKLFDRIKQDSIEYGDPAFGLDFERIDFMEIGPIGSNYYGYSYGFTFNSEV